MHDGKDYNPTFGIRMRGTGPFADLIQQRFQRAYRELGFKPFADLNCGLFQEPRAPSAQADLFDPV